MSSEEATVFLTGQSTGAYMIRFTTAGELAASFIHTNFQVMHAIIKQEAPNKFIIPTEEGPMGFPSIKDVVAYFVKAGVFTLPCSNLSSIFSEGKVSTKRSSTESTKVESKKNTKQ